MPSLKGISQDFTPPHTQTHHRLRAAGPKSALSSQPSMGISAWERGKPSRFPTLPHCPLHRQLQTPSHSSRTSTSFRSGRLETLKLCKAPSPTTFCLAHGVGVEMKIGNTKSFCPCLSLSPFIFISCLLMWLSGSQTLCTPHYSPLRATAPQHSSWLVTSLRHGLHSAPVPR